MPGVGHERWRESRVAQIPQVEPISHLFAMRYLTIDFSEGADGLTTIEAMASTPAADHAAVIDEVRQIMDWAWRRFPHTHGSTDDCADWDDDLQVSVEDDRWHAVALTLTGSARFVEAFLAEFGDRDAA